MENNNHFEYSLKIYGLTFLSAPIFLFLILAIFEIESGFNFSSMIATLGVFILLFIITLPTLYGILFVTKILFKTDTSIFLLRFIIYGLSFLLFTLNISILVYPFFGLDIITISYLKSFFICLFIFIFSIKINRPKFHYKNSSDLNLLDDDFHLKK